MGDRLAHLAAGIEALAAAGEVTAVSSVWETAAVAPEPQPDYLNAVVVLDTVLGPFPVLRLCQAAERAAGRRRRRRWAPRRLDLDLLLYGDAEIDVPGLSVPHPRMADRRFVLAPLAEAWPGAVIPGEGPVADLLQGVADQGARRLGDSWPVSR